MRKHRFKAKEVRRVTAWRKKKNAEAKAAWHAMNKSIREARAAHRVARQDKRALDLRKHATQHAGWLAGFTTMTPQTKAELKAQSWAKRYREAYAEGRAERQRCDTLLIQQQAQTTPVPVTIRLS